MDTLKFKGVQYRIKEISSKSEFDRIYEKLLKKANKGGSITGDLAVAYRISGRDIYLIRYDESRHALIPVRVAQERVDGKLMRNRYDDKQRQIQTGIGQELARQSEEAGKLRSEQDKRRERDAKIAEQKRKQQQEKLLVHGGNFREQLLYLPAVGKELLQDFAKYDVHFRENRDYQLKVRKHVEAVEDQGDKLKTEFSEIERDPEHYRKTVQHLIPEDIQSNIKDNGFLQMLEYWTFITAYLVEVEKEWISMYQYDVERSDLPFSVNEKMENALKIIENSRYFCNALEKLLFPEKLGAEREKGIYYDTKKVSWKVVAIFNHLQAD